MSTPTPFSGGHDLKPPLDLLQQVEDEIRCEVGRAEPVHDYIPRTLRFPQEIIVLAAQQTH